jgi:endonuclease YncB( thermonuclease family)
VDTRGAIRSLFCGALLATWTTLAGAAEVLGPVVSILDGDTIEVLHNQHPDRIRLSGIDCPEKGLLNEG